MGVAAIFGAMLAAKGVDGAMKAIDHPDVGNAGMALASLGVVSAEASGPSFQSVPGVARSSSGPDLG